MRGFLPSNEARKAGGCLPLHEMDRHRWKGNRFRLKVDGSLSFDVKLGATKYIEESTN